MEIFFGPKKYGPRKYSNNKHALVSFLEKPFLFSDKFISKALVAPQISGARSFPRSLLKKGARSTLRSFQNKRNALIPRSSAKERPFLLPLLFQLENISCTVDPLGLGIILNYISFASIVLKKLIEISFQNAHYFHTFSFSQLMY